MALVTRQLQIRQDTAANWTSSDPVLAVGEMGYESDTGKFKIGDGSTTWGNLVYSTLTINETEGRWGQEFEQIADTDTSHNFNNLEYTKNFHYTALTANRTVTISNAKTGSQLFIDVTIAAGNQNLDIIFAGVGTPKYHPDWVNTGDNGVTLPGSLTVETEYTIAGWYNGTRWKFNVIEF